MNALEFVKEYGLDYSKGVLEVVPKSANFVEWYPLRSRFYITDVGCNRAVLLTDLKQVVEAFELVEAKGGLISSKKYLKFLHSSVDMGLYHGLDDVNYETEIPLISKAIDFVEQCQ